MYLALVTVHVLAATLWVGGLLFLALVGGPVLRAVEPAELRARLFAAVGLRFRSVGWAAVGVLLLTGIPLLRLRGWWGPALWSPEFRSRGAGSALAWKLLLAFLMLALSLAHDIALSPARAQRLSQRPDGAAVRRRWVLVARAAALGAVAVVVAAVRLVRA